METTLRDIVGSENNVYLRSGNSYRESLRDGRRVWFEGEYLEDITSHPKFSGTVDMICRYFDAHQSGPLADILTEKRENGTVSSAAYMIPRNTEDLRRRGQVINAVVDMTHGTMGRGPDFMPTMLLGMYGSRELYIKSNPELGSNVERYYEWARQNNPIMTLAFVDPQGDRTLPAEEREYLRVVDRTESGIVVSGAKVVATLSPFAEEIIVHTLYRKDLEKDNAISCAIPVNTKGVTIVCREGWLTPGKEIEHPLSSRVDEIDAMIVFDRVFVPYERVFYVGDTEIPKYYSTTALWGHWHVMARITRRYEFIAGAASLIPKVIGTEKIPQVRDSVAETLRCLETCRAFLRAAEENYGIMGGVAHADDNIITTGRMYSVEQYPKMMNILREISGQGLIMRFPDKAFDDESFGTVLKKAINAQNYSGREKTRIFNYVWDLCSDSFASRLEMFEVQNAQSVPKNRQLWFDNYSKEELTALEEKVCRIVDVPTPSF
ncbi:4-hydroxyphenylacetate 3-hydroxylase N-terminal domain-containing protein [Peribacillus glennii]|nr:4-hydroxyphenylacetate 3-hydroxylase N-terminal domain-containing protein [Peribacillus glennii]